MGEDCHDQPGEAAPGAKIRPKTALPRPEIKNLGGVYDVAIPPIGQGTFRNKVDPGRPLFEHRREMAQPLLCFT